jgi:hypothetical protein
LDGRKVFRVRNEYLTDLLIDLEAAKVISSTPFRRQLEDMDKRKIQSILEGSEKALKSDEATLPEVQLVNAALLQCPSYSLTSCVPLIRKIESAKRLSSYVSLGGSAAFTKAKPISGSWSYRYYETRRLAALALRRLGEAPSGYPAIVFSTRESTKIIAADVRRAATVKLKNGQTPAEVHELMGDPDYIENAVPLVDDHWDYPARRWYGAWRYDVDGSVSYTLLLIWGEAGELEKVEKVTPPLWHGNKLFDSEKVQNVIRPDGSIGQGMELYQNAFRGHIETIVPP